MDEKGKEFESHSDMMMLLMADAMRSRKELEENKGADDERAFWARTHTRAAFAAIEGACELFLRQAFVAECNKVAEKGEISFGKLSVLAGETYSVNDKGEIQCQKIKTKFVNHVLLSLNSYAEAQGATHRTRKGNNWPRILKAVSVRDRVTHPKNLTSLAITNEEIEDIDFALKWFFDEVVSILNEKGGDLEPMPDLPWASASE